MGLKTMILADAVVFPINAGLKIEVARKFAYLNCPNVRTKIVYCSNPLQTATFCGELASISRDLNVSFFMSSFVKK